jgi:hypothetical protein
MLLFGGIVCHKTGLYAAAATAPAGTWLLSVEPSIRAAQRSAIMYVGAFVFQEVMRGITEASTTRRLPTP